MQRSTNILRHCRCAQLSKFSGYPTMVRTRLQPIRAPAALHSRYFETAAMKIEKSFQISRPRETVWDAFADVRLVADCLPGASITEDLGGGNYKGNFAIKL